MVIDWGGSKVWDNCLRISNIRTVNLKLQFIGGGHSIYSNQIFHWVVEVEFLDLGSRGNSFLCLRNKHVLWCGRQSGALIGVEVNELNIDFRVSCGCSTPCDSQFNIVVLKGNQWDRRLGILTKRKSEWVERFTRVSRFRVRLVHNSWCESRRKLIILFINDLSTNEKFNLGNSSAPVSKVTTSISDVDIPDHIPFSFKPNGRHTVRGWVALDNLSFNSLGEICVTFVVGPEKRNFRLADEMRILGTYGNELSNTSRHILYYTKVLFF